MCKGNNTARAVSCSYIIQVKLRKPLTQWIMDTLRNFGEVWVWPQLHQLPQDTVLWYNSKNPEQ